MACSGAAVQPAPRPAAAPSTPACDDGGSQPSLYGPESAPDCRSASTSVALARCLHATSHQATAEMARARLELFWTDASAGSGDDGATEDAKSGFVALYHVGGQPLAFVPAIGGADAKGYGQAADVRLVGADVRRFGKHTVITVRWEQRTRVYSTGMGGTVDRRDVIAAVCTIDGQPSCPFVRPTETDISVLGSRERDEQVAWQVDIAGDGWLTATPIRSSGGAKRGEGAEPTGADTFVSRSPCPIRVRLWPA